VALRGVLGRICVEMSSSQIVRGITARKEKTKTIRGVWEQGQRRWGQAVFCALNGEIKYNPGNAVVGCLPQRERGKKKGENTQSRKNKKKG